MHQLYGFTIYYCVIAKVVKCARANVTCKIYNVTCEVVLKRRGGHRPWHGRKGVIH